MDRILLRFSEENVEEPITSKVILELGMPMRIVTATINSQGGDILIEVPRIHINKVIEAFRKKGVVVTFPKPNSKYDGTNPSSEFLSSKRNL